MSDVDSGLLRSLNERIRENIRKLNLSRLDEFDLVCECGKGSCTGVIHMPGHDFESMRTDPEHFAVVPGHERSDEVVERNDRYVLVRKGGS